MSRLALPAAALAVLALAVVVRFTGLGWLLPSLIEPDAHIVVQVDLLERGEPDPERSIDWGKYPHLVAWTTRALVPRSEWGSLDASAPLEEHLELAISPTVRVRTAVALLSLLALPATWLVARLYVPRGWRLYAVALTATSLLAVHFGTQARPHGAAIAFPALAVVACVHVRRRPDWPAYGLASAACALSLAALQSGIAAFLPLGVAHLLTARGRGWRHHLKLLPAAAGFALALALFYPFWFAGSEGGRVELEGGMLDQAGHKINLRGFDGKGFSILVRALWSWEPALFVGLLVALAPWLWRLARRRGSASDLPLADHLVVLSYALPYALVIGLYLRSYERFLIPLVPFLAVLTSWGLWRACAGVGARGLGRAAFVAVLAAFVALPALVVAQLARLRAAPSTFDLAARWVESNVAGSERVLVNTPLILPLYRTPESMAGDERPRVGKRNLMWFEYQEEALGERRGGPGWDVVWIPLYKKTWRKFLSEDPEGFMRSLKGDFAVVEVFEEGRIDPSGRQLVDLLDARAQRLARVSPDAEPEAWEAPLVYQDETGGTVPWMALRVLGAARLGPVLQAYRLPPRREE